MDYFTNIFDSKVKILFSKELVAQVSLIERIQSSSNGVTTVELSNLLSIERRTVLNHIDKINLLIQTMNIQIEPISKVGKRLFFTGNNLETQQIVIQLISQSTVVNLCLQAINQEKVDIRKFMSENFISDSVFYKIIQNLNEYFQQYNIHFGTKKGFLVISGNEGEIRYTITAFLWRLYRGTTWPFPSISFTKISEITDKLTKDFKIELNPSKKDELMYIIAVNILRYRNRQILKKEDLPHWSKVLIEGVFKAQCRDFFNSISSLISIQNDTEIIFIFMWLSSLPGLYLLKNNISSIYEFLDNNIREGLDQFTNAVQKLDRSKDIYQDKLFLSTVIGSRLSVDLFPNIPFTISSISTREYYNRTAPSLIPVIGRLLKSDITLSKNQTKTLALKYSNAFALILPINVFEPKINIYVETDFPIYIEAQIWKDLFLLLGASFNLEIQKSLKSSECDLVLNVNLCPNEPSDKKIPRIYTHVYITDREKKEIFEQCKYILTKKKSYLVNQ